MTKTTSKKEKSIIQITREKFFESQENKGLMSVDMGTKSKVVDSKKVLFLAETMKKQENNFFNLQTLQKALTERIKEARRSCGNKPRKDCDNTDLYYLSLVGKGKIKSGGIVGKVEAQQARKYLYLRCNILINMTTDKVGNLNFQKIDYIPNLLEEIK